jgi:hypothetical protein
MYVTVTMLNRAPPEIDPDSTPILVAGMFVAFGIFVATLYVTFGPKTQYEPPMAMDGSGPIKNWPRHRD